jgi:hypothetical protein
MVATGIGAAVASSGGALTGCDAGVATAAPVGPTVWLTSVTPKLKPWPSVAPIAESATTVRVSSSRRTQRERIEN